jgi:hypothetical protein
VLDLILLQLERVVDWLRVLEQFGEGIFLHIEPDFPKAWLAKPEVIVGQARQA